MENDFFLLMACLFSISILQAQDAKLQGYVYESGNRGYLNLVKVTIYNESNNAIVEEVYSNKDGVFTADLPVDNNYRLKLEKSVFETHEEKVSTVGVKWEEKIFAKIELKRKPGYLFDVTMARKRKKGEEIVEGIEGALIEVYNNTKEAESMVLKDYPHPNFKVSFEQGNHYTLMIRKAGYFNKRMEAFVNVEGCILCFEGVGKVQPGVSDVLTEGNSMGTLLANVELEPIKLNKGIKIENIYYDLAKWDIREDAARELDKLVALLKNNPSIIVELGSHTDSRGRDRYNQRLSQKRAEAAVAYIIEKSGIDPTRIKAKGYGETQLVNKCKNDVDCSERRHQQNRRTELKIVGFQPVDEFADKSLAEIIEAEKFERLLAEVSNSEVVKVAAGDELPEDIQKEMAEEDKEEEGKEEVQDETTIETKVKAEKQEMEPMEQSSETLEDEAMKETEDKQDTRKSQPLLPPASTEAGAKIEPLNSGGEIIEPPSDEPFRTDSEDFGESQASLAGSKMVKEKEVEIAAMGKDPSILAEDYSGYRIEFFVSPYELPKSHDIFSRHGKITMERRKDDSFAYLMGDFEEWRDANKFLNSIVLSQYPKARVVRFKRGKRIN